MEECSICTKKGKTKHLPVFYKDGVDICDECMLILHNFATTMMTLVGRGRSQEIDKHKDGKDYYRAH